MRCLLRQICGCHSILREQKNAYSNAVDGFHYIPEYFLEARLRGGRQGRVSPLYTGEGSV